MRNKISIVIALVLAVPALAVAGGRATFQGSNPKTHQDSTIEIVWQDQHTLRMEAGSSDAWFIIRDGKAYTVTMQGDKPTVMEMGGVMKMFGAMAKKQADKSNQSSFSKPDDIKATGRTETVAGIKGQVYLVKTTDADGNEKTQEVVLTGDPVVVEMTRAYVTAMGDLFDIQGPADFWQALPTERQGLLRSGDDFHVKNVDATNPPDELFELPAKPMSLGSMFGR